MTEERPGFRLPARINRDDGEPRRVGFELEFSGIGLEEATAVVAASLDGRIDPQGTSASQLVSVDGLGEFTVEIDWSFLKRKAQEAADGDIGGEWVEPLSQAAPLLVPVEVVCPPIAMTRLQVLDPMVSSLREAGAVGTEESLIAAYGVHINPELPALDAATIDRYLRAFALLQWWLIDTHDVDLMRRVTPYIDPYPEAYLKTLLSREHSSLDDIFDDYLQHNATRNRSLDLLPLLAEIDEERTRAAVDDDRIKARPTFHYRLPNCQIERPGWTLALSWNTWCVVEELAERAGELRELSGEFLASDRPVIGINRSAWVDHMQGWLSERDLL